MLLISLNITMLLNHSHLSKQDFTSALSHCVPASFQATVIQTDRFSGAVIQSMHQSWHNYWSQPKVGTSLPGLSTDLSTYGFSQLSLRPQPIFCLQAYFFPLIPEPIRWQSFTRLKDKEELLLWTCFCTALSGEALSPIIFWPDPLSHSCLPTSFIYKAINSEMKASENPIWKGHKNPPGSAPTNMSRWHHSFQQEHTVMQILSASEKPILQLCRSCHATRRVLFAPSTASLYPFPSFLFLSSTKQPLSACFHGILSTLLKRNKTPTRFLWHSI